MLRSALFACSAALIALAATANAQPSANADACAETTFRVYFNYDSTSLSSEALTTLAAAQQRVAECSYAELVVSVDATSRRSPARGAAIVQAATARGWDVVRVEPRTMLHRAGYSDGPDYVSVLMTPNVTTPAPAPATPSEDQVGV